ncbi:MAG: hypothetical protein ABI624_24665 [Casimicrobiaceae bacterium]
MGTKDNVHGEGNYEATRQYNDATRKFIDSGRVEQAARDAAPKTPEEAVEMKEAEHAALLHAKLPPAGTPVDRAMDKPVVKGPAVKEPVVSVKKVAGTGSHSDQG